MVRIKAQKLIQYYFPCLYVINQYKKDNEKLWIGYITVVSVKFFVILGFIYLMTELFDISKIEALNHVLYGFLFIYT